VELVACSGVKGCTYVTFFGKGEGKRLPKRPRHKSGDSTILDLN
jgi:hypothetical protein